MSDQKCRTDRCENVAIDGREHHPYCNKCGEVRRFLERRRDPVRPVREGDEVQFPAPGGVVRRAAPFDGLIVASGDPDVPEIFVSAAQVRAALALLDTPKRRKKS